MCSCIEYGDWAHNLFSDVIGGLSSGGYYIENKIDIHIGAKARHVVSHEWVAQLLH